jgi:hypothetical protein
MAHKKRGKNIKPWYNFLIDVICHFGCSVRKYTDGNSLTVRVRFLVLRSSDPRIEVAQRDGIETRDNFLRLHNPGTSLRRLNLIRGVSGTPQCYRSLFSYFDPLKSTE